MDSNFSLDKTPDTLTLLLIINVGTEEICKCSRPINSWRSHSFRKRPVFRSNPNLFESIPISAAHDSSMLCLPMSKLS